MKPAAFDYHCPSTLEEALSLLISSVMMQNFIGGDEFYSDDDMRLARPEILLIIPIILMNSTIFE